MNINDEIVSYSDRLNELELIPNMVKSYGLSQIFSELEKMLNRSPDQVLAALLFLKDISIFRKDNPIFNQIVDSFRKLLITSKIFSILEEKLYSSHTEIRLNTIYTLGKIYFPNQSFRLLHAIDVYAKKYPTELDILLFEYFWLSGSIDYTLLQKLVNLSAPQVTTAIRKYLESLSDEMKIQIEKRINW